MRLVGFWYRCVATQRRQANGGTLDASFGRTLNQRSLRYYLCFLEKNKKQKKSYIAYDRFVLSGLWRGEDSGIPRTGKVTSRGLTCGVSLALQYTTLPNDV